MENSHRIKSFCRHYRARRNTVRFDDEKPILVSYRDSSGSDELFPVKDLIQKPTVILTDEDINVGGVIKKGNIMSLYMEEVSESSTTFYL